MASIPSFSFTNLIAATADGEAAIVSLGNSLLELARNGKPVSLGIYVSNELLPRFSIPPDALLPPMPTTPVGKVTTSTGVKIRSIPNGTERGLLPLGAKFLILESRVVNNVEHWRIGENCWIATRSGTFVLAVKE